MSARADRWTIEKIQGLATTIEIANLRFNAQAAGETALTQRCDAVLRDRKPNKDHSDKAVPYYVPCTALDSIAALIRELPPAKEIPLVQERLKLQEHPITTFSELWRRVLICGFSSTENSDPNTRLGIFANSESPLLNLTTALAHGGDQAWVVEQLRSANMTRYGQNKRPTMVAAVLKVFRTADRANDVLADGRSADPDLNLYIDLASSRRNDHDLATSRGFSTSLKPTWFLIKKKQMRNVLVNSGLARNVVPLDTRWIRFFGKSLQCTSQHISGSTRRYHEVEDVLRQALLQAQQYRSDIPNLAILDAMVFAYKSPRGHGVEGWAGSHVTSPTK